MEIKARKKLKKRTISSCSMPGVWRAACYLEGAVVIFHSPRACAHVARRKDISSYFRNIIYATGKCSLDTVPLLTSDLEEEEAVFGGEYRLRRAIRYAVETYNPKVILIGNSCVSGVIGDDTKAIAAEMEAETGVPICAASAHGYLEEGYFQGYIDITKQLIARFMKPQSKVSDTVMLFGYCGGLYGDFLIVLKRLLGYFGMKITVCFPSFGSVKELEMAPSVSLIVVLGRYSDRAKQIKMETIAEKIGNDFGIPVVTNHYPVGFDKTIEWIRYLGQFVNRQELAEEGVQAETKAYEEKISAARKWLKGKKVIFCSGRVHSKFYPERIISLVRKLELDFLGVYVLDCFTDKERDIFLERITETDKNLHVISGKESEAVFKEADFVLTTHGLANTDVKQIHISMMNSAGWRDEIELIEKMKRTICRQESRGGRFYEKGR